MIGSDSDGQAEHIPGIGHFIKYISNGFYTLKLNNMVFSGLGLLDISRIKSISADASRNLREFNKVRNNIADSAYIYNIRQDHLDQGRVVCLKRIDSIFHHHCGNHEYCE